MLLSDCRATDGEDPLPAAVRPPELLVVAPVLTSLLAAGVAGRP